MHIPNQHAAFAVRGFGIALAGRRANRDAARLIGAGDAAIAATGLHQDPSEAEPSAAALARIGGCIGHLTEIVAWLRGELEHAPARAGVGDGRDNGRMHAFNIFSVENLEGRVDVARAVGSTATAMFIYDLEPGQSSCPYHHEYEEEWLLVIDGIIVVRTPDGERTLERGDLVRFPSGPAGAHKVRAHGRPAPSLLPVGVLRAGQ